LRAEAERAFGRCIAADFHAEEACEQRAVLRLRRGDTGGAQADARALFASPARGAAARLVWARAAMLAKDARGAVAALEPLASTGRADAEMLFVLGRAYLDCRRPADAARVLRDAHARTPSDLPTSIALGIALSDAGELGPAEQLFRELAATHPDDPAVLQNLAAVLSRRGLHDEANRLEARARALRDAAAAGR